MRNLIIVHAGRNTEAEATKWLQRDHQKNDKRFQTRKRQYYETNKSANVN